MENFDINEFIASYEAANKKRSRYNGFSNDEKGEKRQAKFFGIMREWSNTMIEKNELADYLGEKSFAELEFLLQKDRRFDIFPLIIEETETHYTLRNKTAMRKKLKQWKAHKIFEENAYYVCIRFKTSIKDFYYVGDNFLALNKNTTAEEGLNMVLDMANPNDFFPKLQEHIESLIPVGEFDPDYWEFGTEDFGLYWNISAKAFPKFIKTFKAWIKYEQLENKFLYYWVHENKSKNHWHFDLIKMTDFSDTEIFPQFLI